MEKRVFVSSSHRVFMVPRDSEPGYWDYRWVSLDPRFGGRVMFEQRVDVFEAEHLVGQMEKSPNWTEEVQ